MKKVLGPEGDRLPREGGQWVKLGTGVGPQPVEGRWDVGIFSN